MNTKKICSWDVGILNLAYCIIEKNIDNNTCNIIDWNVIDLTDKQIYKCNYIQKNKSMCTNNALFYKTINDTTTNYYCKLHSKNYKPFEDNWESVNIIPQQNKVKCTHDNCTSYSKFIYNNNNYCRKHKESLVKNLIKESNLCKIKKTNAVNHNLQLLAENICKKIDLINGIYEVDEVIIEHQPVLKNPTIKSIGCFIFHQFVSKCVGSNKQIKFVSASNKLKLEDNVLSNIVNTINNDDKLYIIIFAFIKKYFNMDPNIKSDDALKKIVNTDYKIFIKFIINISTKKLKKNNITDHPIIKLLLIDINIFKKFIENLLNSKLPYDINKLLSVKYTATLITQPWIDFLNGHKKKDDLCDSYLQAYAYINK